MHFNVWGSFNVHARGGYEYFIMLTNDYSRFGYVYLMHRKSDAFDKLIEFKVDSENQLVKCIKALRSYQGGEYMSTQFNFFLTEHKIISQLSALRTPQQNGVAEIRNRMLMDMVKSMMSFSSLLLAF